MPGGLCKLLGMRCACRLAALAVFTLPGLAGCTAATRYVSADLLEQGRPIIPHNLQRIVVSDAETLDSLSSPLGARLSLIEVRNQQEWESLRSQAPEIGPPPDFDRGIVVGLVSHAGIPADGSWPIELECVLVHEGAGFALGHFHAGTFFADSTTYVEFAQIRGLRAVLMVDVNGSRFCAK